MLTGLLCAVIGGYMGHWFTIRLFNERVNAQSNAFYGEFELIRDTLTSHVKGLIEDFEGPLKDCYTGLPHLDMSLTNNLVLELSASKKIPNKDLRKMINSLNHVSKTLTDKQIKRDTQIERWFKESNEIQGKEKHALTSSIHFHTSQILVVVIDIIFHASKVVSERNKFSFSKHTNLDYAEVTCRVCGIQFNKPLWERIISRSIPLE
jgi:hypothetical protein